MVPIKLIEGDGGRDPRCSLCSGYIRTPGPPATEADVGKDKKSVPNIVSKRVSYDC